MRRKQEQRVGFPFNYKQSAQLMHHKEFIRVIAISTDDKLMATGSYEGRIVLRELSNLILRKTLYKNDKSEILDLTFSKNSQLLAATSNDCDDNILIFKLVTPNQICSFKLKANFNLIQRLVFTPDSQFLLSGDINSSLTVWDLQTQQAILLKSLSSAIRGICVSINQKYIASGCDDGYVYLFCQITKLNQFFKLKGGDSTYSTTFTPDSQKLIVGGWNIITIWSIGSSVKMMRVFRPQLVEHLSTLYTWRVNIVLNGTYILFTIHNSIQFWSIKTSHYDIAQVGEIGIFSNVLSSNMIKVKSQCVATSDLNYIILLSNSGKVTLQQRSR